MEINYGCELVLDLLYCDKSKLNEDNLKSYIDNLCNSIKMKKYGNPMFWKDDSNSLHLNGISVVQFIETSNIVVHALNYFETVFVNIFSCKEFDFELVKKFSKEFFNCKEMKFEILKRKTIGKESLKIELREHSKFGKGVFAKEQIEEGELISIWDGEIYFAKKASDLPKEAINHAMQFDFNSYRLSNGIAHYLNHSCDPNCGIKDRFKIVAMRDIEKDEELTWDYEMTEDSDWRMECECESKNCRKVIGSFQNLPKETKKKYEGYISDYLTVKS